MMRHITQKQALRAAKELATDTVYTRSMSTGWKPPAEARECVRPVTARWAGCCYRRQSALMTHTWCATSSKHCTLSGSSAGSPGVHHHDARFLLSCLTPGHRPAMCVTHSCPSPHVLPCELCRPLGPAALPGHP
jgi:hypothetical protein